ncbi:MAG: SDR family NAD(P)-dependent oxidoreductase [Phaeodactylibacter sp.]|nr:SDR family NAD(P)-dependent oxidoreductase [Phaeodactylibacter sp.]MCB9266940.1 SDR family NAD(P)-dependent oxidoreductase [Lewinellaceae bacterium]
MVTTGAFHGVARSEVGLKFLPQPDRLAFSLPGTHITLVANEGSELTAEVLRQLEQEGHPAVVLNLPNVPNPVADRAITISSASDEAVRTAIEAVRSHYGEVGSFIYLHPHFEFQQGNFIQHFPAEREIVKTLFFLAKHLQKPLNDLGKQQRASFLAVTRMDGQLGQGRRGNVSVFGGGITGLVKCLNLEWAPVFCRVVDIQPELHPKTIAAQAIAEWLDPDVSHVEVAFSEEGRKTTSVQPVEVPEHQEIRTNVTSGSVFLVSGGARGVTATCVIEMAKAFQCKFILLGRSSYGFEIPAFAGEEQDESALKRLIMEDMKARGEKPNLAAVKQIYNNIVAKREIDDTISRVEAHGGRAIYVQGDVTNPASFQMELKAATDNLGKVTGIIHGAGRLADKYIQDKTEADFENVLSVKLDGLLALLQSVNIHQLDHLILFSSVAGFYGNVGQTDYAIANEILSKAAYLFKTNHPNTHVSAINWGAWDSGMVSGELKAQFEAAGVTLVNSQGGAAMLVNELNEAYANQPQVIIGGTLPAAVSYLGDELRTYRIHRKLTLEANPFLNHHVIQGKAVLPVVNAIGWMAHTCEKVYPDYNLFKVEHTRLFKGIVFDGTQKEDYIVELKEVAKNAEQIVFETTVLSEGEKLPTFHYKATVTLLNKKMEQEAPKLNPQLSGRFQPENGKGLYEDGSLFHGHYFQGIEQVLDCTDSQIVLSCKAPEVPLSEQGQFPVGSVNTFFTDIQYQGMVVWVQRQMEGAKSLPLQTDSAVVYRNIPFGKELFVHIGITEATDFKMVAECTVYDEEGTVYMKTTGATVTVSKQLVW